MCQIFIYFSHSNLEFRPSFSMFRFDGQLIFPYMTPEQVGLEDGDIIDVYVSRPSETGKRAREEGEDHEGASKRGMEF